MYPVAQKFHEIITQDGTRTRLRVYLFDNTVDPTDDNDVQTNGTLLKMDANDTDSNNRIEASGANWTDIFNSKINPQIGSCVSEQFRFGLINTDGAYSVYQFDRCKMYLDAEDEATGTWYACPMGAYIIETPAQTYSSVINLSGYDMMQDLNKIADTWFNALDYTTPLTISDILTSLAMACGKTIKPSTLTNLVNKTVSFSAAPFVSVERTYKDILAWIAEVTASVARFDRDGYLELRWFDEAQINGITHYVNVDISGCGVYDILRGSYTVAQIDGVLARSVKLDNPVSVGSTGSVYQIMGNPFIADDDATDVTNKITPILTKLNSLGAYTPLSVKAICDPSIEAGDIINVIYGGATYRMPVFQQTLAWRGSYVMGLRISSGQENLPLSVSEQERDEYRTEKEFTDRVTFTDLATGGQTVINGDNITTGTISADRIRGGHFWVGGVNDMWGIIYILNENGAYTGALAKQGLDVYGTINGTSYDSTVKVYSDGIRIYTNGLTNCATLKTTQSRSGYFALYDSSGNTKSSIDGNTVKLYSTSGGSTEEMLNLGVGGITLWYSGSNHSTDDPAIKITNNTGQRKITISAPPGQTGSISLDPGNGIQIWGNGLHIGSQYLDEAKLQQLLALI